MSEKVCKECGKPFSHGDMCYSCVSKKLSPSEMRDHICIDILASSYGCTKEHASRVWEICKDIPATLSKLADHIIKTESENKKLKSDLLEMCKLAIRARDQFKAMNSSASHAVSWIEPRTNATTKIIEELSKAESIIKAGE